MRLWVLLFCSIFVFGQNSPSRPENTDNLASEQTEGEGAHRLGLVSREVAKSIRQPASSLQIVTASRFRRAAPAAGRHHAGRAETTLGSAGLAGCSQAVGHHFFDYRAGVAVRRQSAEQQERRHG
jgi:hypothetical protein